VRCAGGAAQERRSAGAGPAGPRAREGRRVGPGKKVWAGFLVLVFLSISLFLILIQTQAKRIQINLNSNSNQTTKEKMLQHECNNKV
jgi:cell division protein FtsL